MSFFDLMFNLLVIVKITNIELLSCALIVSSFYDFISFNAFCSLFEIFGRVKTNGIGLNKSFSISSESNSRLHLFVSIQSYTEGHNFCLV